MGSKLAEFVVGSESNVTLTHSEGQHCGLCLRGSKPLSHNEISPLGLYPSTEVDRAIFGTKFRAQKHKGGRSSNQSNGLSKTSIDFSLAFPARVNRRAIQMKVLDFRVRMDFGALLVTHARMIHELCAVNHQH